MLAILGGMASKAWAWLALAGAIAAGVATIWFKGRAEGKRNVERAIEERDRDARRTRRDIESIVRGAGDDDLDRMLRPPGRRDD